MSSTAPIDHYDEQKAAAYEERWAPLAPLRESLHLQTEFILQELPTEARVLCVGAGTGAEVLALARRFPGWRFLAVDPSRPMLEICRRRVTQAGFAERCEFHPCFVHELPAGVRDVDAATAMLVSHFITQRAARLAFFQEIGRRLRSGGLLITADLGAASAEHHPRLLDVWLRLLRFAGASPEEAERMRSNHDGALSLLTAAAMETLLGEAGFVAPVLFSQSLLIHAWAAQRP